MLIVWFSLACLLIGSGATVAVIYFRDLPLVEALQNKDKELKSYQSRCDRLTEAIALKADIPLVFPNQEPQVLEKIPGWYDKKKVSIVNSKSSGEN